MFKKIVGRVHNGTLGMKEVENDIKLGVFLTVIRLCLINITCIVTVHVMNRDISNLKFLLFIDLLGLNFFHN